MTHLTTGNKLIRFKKQIFSMLKGYLYDYEKIMIYDGWISCNTINLVGSFKGIL